MLKKCFAAFFTQAVVLTLAHQPVMAQAGGGMPMRYLLATGNQPQVVTV